jgi:hypothetical protein
MIEEATVDGYGDSEQVDGYGDSEQAAGWFAMLEQHLTLPFETRVLGNAVTVTRIALSTDDRINAICTGGRGCARAGRHHAPAQNFLCPPCAPTLQRGTEPGIERERLVQTISWVWWVSPRLLSLLFGPFTRVVSPGLDWILVGPIALERSTGFPRRSKEWTASVRRTTPHLEGEWDVATLLPPP